MESRGRRLLFSRGGEGRGAAFSMSCLRGLNKPSTARSMMLGRATARDLVYFSQDTGTSQHRMAWHDQSRLACVGWQCEKKNLRTEENRRTSRRSACCRHVSWKSCQLAAHTRVGRSVGREDRPPQWGVVHDHTPVSIPVIMNTKTAKSNFHRPTWAGGDRPRAPMHHTPTPIDGAFGHPS